MRLAFTASVAAATLVFAGAARAETNFSDLYPSIVRVVGLSQEGVGLGSGIVVSSDGQGSYVVTNFHVIANAEANGLRIVASKTGKADPDTGKAEVVVVPAKYWGGDRSADLAILYVPNFHREPIPLAVGQTPENMPIRAIGYSGTDLDQWNVMKTTPSIMDGIISASETAPWRPGAPAVKQIQHTADLNGGMSGGPLMDLCGRVVGINTMYNSQARGSNLSLSASDLTPYLKKQNLTFKAETTACDPNAVKVDVAKQEADKAAERARVIEAAAAAERANWMKALAAAAVVVALGVAGYLAVRRRGATGAVVSPSKTSGPPHGLVLKGVNDAAGTSEVVRAEALGGESGVELGRKAGFGSRGTSRRHARLIWSSAEGFMIRDLGSENGTRVNGREVKGGPDAALRLGDTIEFGAPDARYSIEKL